MTRTTLYPGPRAGTRWREGRYWRITAATDGSVTEHDHRRRERVVARPGEIARVVLVPGDRTGRRLTNLLPVGDVFALFGDGDRLLRAVAVESIALGYRREMAPEALARDRSGIADIALTLGLALEPATDREIAVVRRRRRHVTDGPLSDRQRRLRAAHLALIVVLCTAWGLSFAADRPGPASPWETITLLIAVTSAVVLAVPDAWGTLTFARRPPLPTPAAAFIVPSVAGLTDPAAKAWARTGVLQIGADDVVLDEHATETWLPGPARGGVVACVVSMDAVHFVDRRSTKLLSLPARMWVLGHEDHPTLTAACAEAGIEMIGTTEYDDLPAAVASVYTSASATFLNEEGTYAYTLPSLSDQGSAAIVTPVFSGLFGLLLFVQGLLGVLPGDDSGRSTAVDLVTLVGGAVAVGATAVSVIVRRSMNRAMRHGRGRLGGET
jgi:hypothetical protein